MSRRRTNGEYRARTGDLLVANQALSQLSYSPLVQASKFHGYKVSKQYTLKS